MAAAAAQAFAAEPRSAWYVQGGVAEDAQSLTVGMSRDWQWEKQYRYGHISGQWQGEVARWHSDSRTSTQLGVTPALRLPIFDGKRLRAQLRGKQADLDAAIAQYNALVLDAVKQSGDAIASVQSLGRQQSLQAESLRKAEQAYSFAVQRYKAGLATQITVLNTETQVIAQRRLAVDLKARELNTRISLMKALGGGWQDNTASTGLSS